MTAIGQAPAAPGRSCPMPESLKMLQGVLAEAQTMGQCAPSGAGKNLPGWLAAYEVLESAVYNAKETGWRRNTGRSDQH